MTSILRKPSKGGGQFKSPYLSTPRGALLGAQWVGEHGDPALAAAARDLLAKIAAVVPARLQTVVTEPTIGAPPRLATACDGVDVAQVRTWIRHGRKMRIRYHDQVGRESTRTIWPTVVGYTEAVRLLAAWCESRKAFRHFRADRIVEADFLDERHDLRPAVLRAQWQRDFEAERRRPVC